jgi:hypothetical protein
MTHNYNSRLVCPAVKRLCWFRLGQQLALRFGHKLRIATRHSERSEESLFGLGPPGEPFMMSPQ